MVHPRRVHRVAATALAGLVVTMIAAVGGASAEGTATPQRFSTGAGPPHAVSPAPVTTGGSVTTGRPFTTAGTPTTTVITDVTTPADTAGGTAGGTAEDTASDAPTTASVTSTSPNPTPAASSATPGGTTPASTAPGSTAPGTPSPGPPGVGIDITVGNARQLITVVATSPTATTARLTAWQRKPSGGWAAAFGPMTAWVGSMGIGRASESVSRTPEGTFTLTEAFGALADPGSGLPYRRTTPDDWWVSDVDAPGYNTWQTCAASSCPFDTAVSEHLQSIRPAYDYAVVMDYNRFPVQRGAGSAFFLHITDGKPTAGCVAIPRSALVSIMQWLDPQQHPRIATGVV